MSLRSWVLGLALVLGACAVEKPDPDEPQTAREKLRREAKRDKDEDVPSSGKQWGKWRYTGDRAECFFRLGARCFKTEAAACASARCKKPKKCHAEGASPAEISCK